MLGRPSLRDMPDEIPDAPGAGPSASLPVLDTDEQRVLGSLLEKEVTVPASYPMSVNAVRTACNQTSSREPVLDLDEAHVHHVLRALKDKDLVGVTWQDSGRRTLKYVQRLSARLEPAPDERALLTVLLLRGPQQPGALRSRTERLHAFADRGEVEACLAKMAAAEPPLVAELPRRAREQDNRWVHLLGPVAEAAAPEAVASEPAPDREAVLADGPQARDARVLATYGAVAASYADALGAELDELPFERWLLDRVVDLAGPAPVVEVGTGPGHVAAHLAAAGARVTGIDVVPAMLDQARRRHPEVDFEVGDLRSLIRPASYDGWGAVLAWYSLIHLAPSELPSALQALVRPLRPGAWLVLVLVLALHAGEGLRSASTWLGHEVEQVVVLHRPEEVVALARGAGLEDVEWFCRGPVEARGETTERLYVLARRPGA